VDGYSYRLRGQDGGDLSLIGHPSHDLAAGDMVLDSSGRLSLVTAHLEADPDAPVRRLLQVAAVRSPDARL
jgi:hypothetical protein